MTKESVHKEHMTVHTVYMNNNRTSRYRKQKLVLGKGNTTTVGYI